LSTPAFGPASRPRSVRFPEGQRFSNQEGDRPSEKRPRRPTAWPGDSIADALAEGCPTQPFPQRHSYREVCRREKLCTAHPVGEGARPHSGYRYRCGPGGPRSYNGTPYPGTAQTTRLRGMDPLSPPFFVHFCGYSSSSLRLCDFASLRLCVDLFPTPPARPTDPLIPGRRVGHRRRAG